MDQHRPHHDPSPGALWRQVHQTLRAEIASGLYGPGDRLPSEASLATRFGVNRHTVRRALAALQSEGVVHARRGAGVFVTASPIGYRLGPRTRFTQNLSEAGQTGSREILRLETLPATTADAEELSVAPGAPVHVLETVGSAGGVPLTYSHGVFPAERLPDFPRHMRQSGSVTAALVACGVPDYRRQVTRMAAEPASGAMARHLRLPEGAPVLRAVALNVDPKGKPVELGRTWFCSDRIEIVVDEESFR